MPFVYNPLSGRFDIVAATSGTPLPVSGGGTGRATLTDGAILVGDGTNPITMIGPLTDGQLLIGSTVGVDPVPATLTQPAAGITITGGAGTITFALSDDLAAIEGLSTTGLAARTAASTWATRTITAGSGISIADGDGVAGNPTISADATVPTTFTADAGSATPALNNLNLLGTSAQGISSSAAGSTVTYTIADWTTTQKGVGVLATNSESTIGASSTKAVTPSGLATKLGTQTAHSIVLSQGSSNAFTPLGAATNGQLPIGSTGADPVLASLTQPAAGITITGGAGTITFALADDLAAVEGLATTGLATRTAASTWTTRSLANASDGSISFTNGDGVSGNPTVALNNRVRNQGIYWENLGINYNAGTGVFTIRSASGSDLSSSNPGIIVLPSKATPGNFTTYSVTANQDFIDDVGASEIIGNLFGLTTGIAYTQDIPFFIYAVTNDAEDTISFMISRIPHATSAPASANIGTPAAANADTQGSFFSFNSVTVGDYDTNPCACIGSFRMRMSASDDWTVQTLSNSDGIGLFQEGILFNFVVGTFGAASGTFLFANGGTAPVFTTNTYNYSISKTGMCNININLDGDGGTDGVGAVAVLIAQPYKNAYSGGVSGVGSAYIQQLAGASTVGGFTWISAVNQYFFVSDSNNTANILNGSFTNGARTIGAGIHFIIDKA